MAVVTLFALLAGVLPYAGSVLYGFTLDDSNTICGHRGVQGALSFEDIALRDWWGRSQFDTIGTWRPIATLSFWADEHVGAGLPWVFHLSNVVIYAALLILLDRFLRKWAAKALRPSARLLAVASFGSLAIHADVVPSPTGRAELLAAFFSLAALYVATCTPILRRQEAVAAAGFLFLALLSKESATPMAVLIPLFAHRMHFERSTFRRRPLLALALASPLELGAVAGFRVLHMPFMQLGPERAPENPLLAVDGVHRVLGAFDVLAFYLRHFAWGAGLAPDYSYSEPPLLRDGWLGITLGAATMASAIVLVVVSWRRAPRLADAVVAFAASYLTVSNLVVPASAIADRLFFFPSLWLVVAVAMLADGVVATPLARRSACLGALAFIAMQDARATAQSRLWRDDITLLGAAARAYPNVFRTQRNLAHALSDAHVDDGAAWHLAIAETILTRYPSPIARDEIDPAWDREPVSVRLTHLRDTFGAEATCRAVATAEARLTSWEDPTGARLLGDWSREACAPRAIDR